jgi:hypothetical protein
MQWLTYAEVHGFRSLVLVLLLSVAKALTVCLLLFLSLPSLCSRHREPDVFIVAYGKLEVCTLVIVIDSYKGY